ncbi:MAG TPA: photosynthetic complex putative assembly protein PuhB [Woeseiaceae bacterium]
MNELPEHDGEPVAGLPEELPAGESIVWQGSPEWRNLAFSGLHMRKIAIYFLLIFVMRQWLLMEEQAGLVENLQSGMWFAILASLVVALLGISAWLIARSTLYTITTRRIVMRFGVALPMTINLPFSQLEAAGIRRRANGNGDIPLLPVAGNRLSYVVLWPHVRPLQLSRVQPMLRAIPDVEEVAERLATALSRFATEEGAPATTKAALPAVKEQQSWSMARAGQH